MSNFWWTRKGSQDKHDEIIGESEGRVNLMPFNILNT